MDKQTAIRLLGNSVKAAAAAIGITTQAVYAWPDPLPARTRDRVEAAMARKKASKKVAARGRRV